MLPPNGKKIQQKTAVEILVNSLIKLGYLHSNEFGQNPKVIEVINQAKEMEKEQIIDAHFEGLCDETEGYPLKISEQYYELTYGGNNMDF